VHYDRIEAVKGVSLHVDEGSTSPLSGERGGEDHDLEDHLGLKSPTSGKYGFTDSESSGKMRQRSSSSALPIARREEGSFRHDGTGNLQMGVLIVRMSPDQG